jgi:type II secretory pathway component PulK
VPDQPTRPEVLAALTEHLGPHVAAAVLEALPPFDWHSLATKDDLHALEQRLVERFEHRMDARFGTVDSRFAAVDAQFALVDAQFEVMDARFDALEGRLTATMHAEINRQLRWMVGSMLAIVAAVGVVVTAVAGLT